MPYLIDKLFGPGPAIFSAAVCLLIGITFLFFAHIHHDNEFSARRSAMTTVLAFIVIGATLGAISGSIYVLWNKKKLAEAHERKPELTDKAIPAPTTLPAESPASHPQNSGATSKATRTAETGTAGKHETPAPPPPPVQVQQSKNGLKPVSLKKRATDLSRQIINAGSAYDTIINGIQRKYQDATSAFIGPNGQLHRMTREDSAKLWREREQEEDQAEQRARANYLMYFSPRVIVLDEELKAAGLNVGRLETKMSLVNETAHRIKEVGQELGALAEQLPEDERPNTEPQQPIIPPLRLQFTQEQIASRSQDAPFAVKVVVQTNTTLQPASIAIQCTADIVDANFHVIGAGGAMMNVTTGYVGQKKIFWLTFGSPAFRPDNPIVVTLMAKQPIKVMSVKEGPPPP